MYRTCIFCSAGLGANEAIEEFPVGRSLAFDAWKGRLWAVCRRCGRWNLAPIEERWEAVEAAEKLFTDSRMRVQSENIGLAELPDATRLIRVGRALPGELAAWRYGDQLVRRRYRHFWIAGASIAGVAAVGIGVVPLAVAAGLGGLLCLPGWEAALYGLSGLDFRGARRIVHRVCAAESPTGSALLVRRLHLNHARLVAAGDSGVALHLPGGLDPLRYLAGDGRYRWLPRRELVLTGDAARSVLGRALVDANRKGASAQTVWRAGELVAAQGGAAGFLRRAASAGPLLRVPTAVGMVEPLTRPRRARAAGFLRREWTDEAPPIVPHGGEMGEVSSLALEMALHEEQERRALEGELAELEAAWREAEEIAAIADALPDEPPPGRG